MNLSHYRSRRLAACGVSSGEMIRAGYDQTLTISPGKIQYLDQGDAPGSYSSDNAIPWRIGLVTQTNSTC